MTGEKIPIDKIECLNCNSGQDPLKKEGRDYRGDGVWVDMVSCQACGYIMTVEFESDEVVEATLDGVAMRDM